jgi:predicted transcriptional regulator
MEVQFTPDVQAKLDRLAMDSGRPANELLQDALVGYFEEVVELRQTLDSRYDDLKSGKVKPIGGEEFFDGLRLREEALLKKHPPQ